MNFSRPFNTQAGFSLIEIAIVLGILGLLLTLFAGMSTNLISQHRRELTRTRLANIDTALTLFVSQYKRLPCPADGKLASSDPNAGKENPLPAPPASQPANCTPGTSTNNQQDGVVPWVALGLTASDIQDGWEGRFTYRVGPDLVVDYAMDFSSCDPAGTNLTVYTPPPPPPSQPQYCKPTGPSATDCNAAYLNNCTPPNTALTGFPKKGLVVEDVAGNVIMDPCLNRATGAAVSTGAAYVVISHGADGGGAYNGLGIKQDSSTAAGTMEEKNFPYHQYLPSGACPVPTSFLVDDGYNGGYNVGAGVPDPTYHFDDLLSRPNILTVATRAQLGPRSH